MRLKLFLSSLILLSLSAYEWAAPNSAGQNFSPRVRSFRFTYSFTVKDIPAGTKRVRVWIPVPQTDRHQKVHVLAVKAPAKTRMTREPEYGNRMMYTEIDNPTASQTEFTVEYEVTRREYTRGDYEQLERGDQKGPTAETSLSTVASCGCLLRRICERCWKMRHSQLLQRAV